MSRARPYQLCRAPLRSVALLCCALVVPVALADPGHRQGGTPESFNRIACYDLVQNEGRMIAWARWEQGYSLEKTQSGKFAAGTPEWMVSLVQRWINDAYSWQVTDEQIYQWAAELGNTEHLPTASRISRHETIAIWMRRIARQCGEST